MRGILWPASPWSKSTARKAAKRTTKTANPKTTTRITYYDSDGNRATEAEANVRACMMVKHALDEDGQILEERMYNRMT